MRILFLLLALGGIGWSEEVSPEQAREIRLKLKVGMTRAQVERAFTSDGGLAVPFKMERYILSSTFGQAKVAKVTLKFKPAGMTEELYRLGNWRVSPQKPADTLMEISRPFLEPMNMD